MPPRDNGNDDNDLQSQLADILDDDTLRPEAGDDTGNDVALGNDDADDAPQKGAKGKKDAVDPEDEPLVGDGKPVKKDNKQPAQRQDNQQRQNPQQQQFEVRVQRAERALAAQRVEMNGYKQKVSAYEAAFNAHQLAGIDPKDVPEAFRTIAEFRRDPVATVKKLLTELQAGGYDTSTIVGGQGASLDPAAIRKMVQDAVKPLTDRNMQETRAAEHMQSVKDEYENFIEAYPHAQANLDVLNQMFQSAPNGMSLENVWLKIENWAYSKGLDPTRPLRAQQQGDNSGSRGARREMPNGRFPTRVVNGQGSSSKTKMLSPNASSREIVMAAIEEATSGDN